MITVESVMSTALLTIKDTDLLSAAAERMNTAGIRHLPVIDQKNHLVGILSTHDFSSGARSRTRRVGQVMSRDVKTVRPDEPAERAVTLMLEHKIGSVPVVDEDEALVGIVTETDFLEVALQALTTGGSKRRD